MCVLTSDPFVHVASRYPNTLHLYIHVVIRHNIHNVGVWYVQCSFALYSVLPPFPLSILSPLLLSPSPLLPPSHPSLSPSILSPPPSPPSPSEVLLVTKTREERRKWMEVIQDQNPRLLMTQHSDTPEVPRKSLSPDTLKDRHVPGVCLCECAVVCWGVV